MKTKIISFFVLAPFLFGGVSFVNAASSLTGASSTTHAKQIKAAHHQKSITLKKKKPKKKVIKKHKSVKKTHPAVLERSNAPLIDPNNPPGSPKL